MDREDSIRQRAHRSWEDEGPRKDVIASIGTKPHARSAEGQVRRLPGTMKQGQIPNPLKRRRLIRRAARR